MLSDVIVDSSILVQWTIAEPGSKEEMTPFADLAPRTQDESLECCFQLLLWECGGRARKIGAYMGSSKLGRGHPAVTGPGGLLVPSFGWSLFAHLDSIPRFTLTHHNPVSEIKISRISVSA